jgi:hypothetical protein
VADSLIASVLEDANPRRRRLAAEGALPLSPDRLLPLQLALTEDEDTETAEAARRSLEAVSAPVVRGLLAADVEPEVLGQLVQWVEAPACLAEIIRDPRVPAEAILERAPRLPAEAQETLILRQDLILEEPAILDALELNPQLDSVVRRRIGEFREYFFAKRLEAPEEAPVEADEATDEEVELALSEALRRPPEGEHDPSTGLSESQIRSLSVAVKVRLARTAEHSTRWILLRDSNPKIALAAFNRSPLGGGEIEQLANSRAVVPEVLEEIASNRKWSRKYQIVHSLVKNPRTPIATSISLVPRLGMRDMRNLSKDRNVPDAVRTRAGALYRMRFR